MITKTRKAIAASGATTENEPIIKSDGASSNVMQWLSNSEASNVTISEDDSNNLDLVVSSGNVGIGGAPTTNLEVFATNPTLVLHSTEHDDGDTNRESHLRWIGEQSGGELSTLCRIQGCHDGSADDQKGQFIFYTNDGSDGDSPTERLRIDSAGNAGFGVSALESWASDYSAIQLGGGASWQAFTAAGAGINSFLNNQCYWDGAWKYLNADEAVQLWMRDGQFSVRVADVGSADAAITWTTPLTIDSAGLVGLGGVAAVHNLGVHTASSLASYTHYTNTTTGTTAGDGFLVGINNSEKATIWNYEATNINIATSNTTRVTIPATGGIYEVGGVLKENLLTNSGFDVWSNSTLEAVATVDADTMASDDTGDWTDSASATLAFDTDHYELATSATHQSIETTFTALTVGKLYKFSLDVKDGTASSQPLYFTWYGGGSGDSPTFTTTGSFVTHTFVFEATGAATAGYIKVSNDMSGGNVELKNFTLKEVTPGCVATDNSNGCDGWYKSNSTKLYREHSGSNTRDGSFYALKTLAGSASTEYIYCFGGANELSDKLYWRERWAGRTVTIGFWVYSVSAADNVKPAIFDGSWNLGSSFAGADAWEWMEFTHTMSASATGGGFGFVLDGDSSDVAYISQPMLVFGSAIGSGNYTRPPGEIVWCETAVGVQQNVSPLAADDKVLNLEALSSGKIPKGAKAINLRVSVRNTPVASGQGVEYGPSSTYSEWLQVLPVVDGYTASAVGWVDCDSNGDIYQKVTEAGSSLAGLYNTVKAVQLR